MHLAHHRRTLRAAYVLGLFLALVVLALQPGIVLAGEMGGSEKDNPPNGPDTTLPIKPSYYPPAAQSRVRAVEWSFHKTDDGAHPNDLEQQILWLMNRARTDPSGEATWLSTTGEPDVSRAREYFKIDLKLMDSEFIQYPSRPPAAFDVRLYEAARSHSNNLITRDSQDHDGQYDRVLEAGFQCGGGWGYYFRGNVFSFAENGLNTHAAWNIDWGGPDGGMQSDRGHRMGVLSVDGDLTNAGIAMVYEDVAETMVGPFVTNDNYCHAADLPNHYNRFLVGTVWEDINANRAYDPGEGIGGVAVRPGNSPFYAITAESGGYAVPITRAGKYKVAFNGPVNGVQEVEIRDKSVLLDWVYTLTQVHQGFHASLSEQTP